MSKDCKSYIFTILGLMAFLLLMMAILCPGLYFTGRNARSIMFQFPEYGILAFGMMFAMITGGIDLSLVGIMNLSGLVTAWIVKGMIPDEKLASSGWILFVIVLAVLAAIVVGAICGAFNGFLIGQLRIPAMLATLCTNQLYVGLVYGITGGSAVTGMCDTFQSISNGRIPGINIPLVIPIFLAVLGICAFILERTILGKEIHYLGANQKAARFSGINTKRVTLFTYMISGIMGGISGVLLTSHLNAVKSSNGSSYTLLSILIVVLGGVHPNGGKGSALGVALSVVLIQMISNAFTLMHISQDVRNFANGVLLVLVLVVVMLARREKRE